METLAEETSVLEISKLLFSAMNSADSNQYVDRGKIFFSFLYFAISSLSKVC